MGGSKEHFALFIFQPRYYFFYVEVQTFLPKIIQLLYKEYKCTVFLFERNINYACKYIQQLYKYLKESFLWTVMYFRWANWAMCHW